MTLQKVKSLPAECENILKPEVDLWDWALRALIISGLFFVIYASLAGHVFQPVISAAEKHEWSRVITRPSLIWVMMGTLLLCFRTFLWFRYRPAEPCKFEDAPRLTVIIPAYNEGEMVGKTIDSVAQALYPEGRLEIFVVDDGSRDDTWRHIHRAAQRHPALVTTVRFRENRGKRAALEEGFRRAQGEIAVTLDSDSVIDKGALLAIAGAFSNPLVGAVAGKVSVYNRSQGLIPRSSRSATPLRSTSCAPYNPPMAQSIAARGRFLPTV